MLGEKRTKHVQGVGAATKHLLVRAQNAILENI